MSLLDELKALGLQIEGELEQLGALVWGAIKSAGLHGEQVVVAAIPGLVGAIRDYAVQEVNSIAKDPAFGNAVGTWKFGTAAARVWSLVKVDFPAAEKLGGALLQGAIETAIQAAFAAMIVGL